MMSQILFNILLASFFVSDIPSGLSPEEKGQAIALEGEKISTVMRIASSSRIYRNQPTRQKITRHMRGWIKPVPGDGDKVIFIMDSPADVKGTQVLTISHKVGFDDQWVYIPDKRRVKRLSSQNKGGKFMGSEYSFEDTTREEPEKFKSRWVHDEVYEGKKCFVVERIPVERTSKYSKLVWWYDQENYLVQKFDHYDKKNVLVKTMYFSKYKLYPSGYWRWQAQKMVNHVTGDHTEVVLGEWEFNTGLTDEDFTINSLKRER